MQVTQIDYTYDSQQTGSSNQKGGQKPLRSCSISGMYYSQVYITQGVREGRDLGSTDNIQHKEY